MRGAHCSGRVVGVCVLVIAAVASQPARADSSEPTPAAATLTDYEVEARRAFIEERLAAGTFGSNAWWYAWLSLTGAYWALNVGLAATTDDPDRRVRTVASAIKTTLTVSTIALLPNPARTAEDKLAAMDDSTPAARAARLAEGERLLRYSAERARKKVGWLSHTINVVVNTLTGAILIYGFDQELVPVALSAGLGIAAMEVSYFTYPQRPRDDVAEYEKRFPPPGASARPEEPVSWSLAASPGGTSLVLRF